VVERQPTAPDKRFDEIGWVTDIRTALRLGKEYNRPIFLYTGDGRMNTGRCLGGGFALRAGPLSVKVHHAFYPGRKDAQPIEAKVVGLLIFAPGQPPTLELTTTRAVHGTRTSRWRSEPFRTRPDNCVGRRGVPGMSKSKLVMIAVDAADSGLVRKWVDKGDLSTFARLLADGLMRRCGPITGRLRGLASGTRRGGSAEGQPASSLPRPGGFRSVLGITLRGPSILALDGRESPSPRCLRSARLALGYPGRLRGHRCRS